jgi:putative glutamine amidotransferase
VKSALKTRKPIMGICLGAQTINIALGGTVIQDLGAFRKGSRDHRSGNHRIQIHPGSQLSRIAGSLNDLVNSRHHQGIGRVVSPLQVAALASDGVIEAIEHTKHPFCLGIQWHPEESPKRSLSKKLFQAFIRAT